MRITTFFIFLVFVTQSSLAQLVHHGSYTLRNGLITAYYYEAGPYGFFPESFIQKNHVDSACVQTFTCKGGKITTRIKTQTEVIYNNGQPVKRRLYKKEKPDFSYQYTTTELPARGLAYTTETYNHTRHRLSLNIHHLDTINNTDSFWVKPSEKKSRYLSAVSICNSKKRVLLNLSYNEKGETSRTVYTYNTEGDQLETRARYQKNKLKYFIDYRCLNQPDTLKIAVTNICVRTDKDPMGNIIEIKEEKIGKKIQTVRKKFSPDRKLLLEVTTSNAKGKVYSRIVYTYDNESRIIRTDLFYGSNSRSFRTNQYHYLSQTNSRSEVYNKKGILVNVSHYYFHSQL